MTSPFLVAELGSLIGIAGSFIAYFIGRALGMYAKGQTPGIIMSVIGAIILLAIYHAVTRNKGAGA